MDKQVQEKLEGFFARYRTYNLEKGTVLIRPEEEPEGIFYLRKGLVKMYAISLNGEELIINTFKAPSFFPVNWVLNDVLSSYYFETSTPVSLTKTPKNDFLRLLNDNPDVVMDLIKRIYKGLDGFFKRIENIMSGKAKNMLVTELLIYAKRFGEKDGNKTIINLKLTEKELASQSGIARETVSRELKKLKDKGLVRFEKNVLTVFDLEKLESELNFY